MLTGVLWADAELRGVRIDYDAIEMEVRESTGLVRIVRCEGYIGYSICGFWDEVVVERAELLDRHEFIDKCVKDIARRFGLEWPETGNAYRNAKTWRALVIHLSDGARLEVVASEFSSAQKT
jgi:hypothetical protein